MPDDSPDVLANPAEQIAWAQRYVRDRYGAKDQAPGDVEVTCSGGITIPSIGVSDAAEQIAWGYRYIKSRYGTQRDDQE